MHLPDKNGVSDFKHLSQYQKSCPEPLPELTPPPFPEALQTYWETFIDLHTSRSYSQGSPEAIPFSELSAWSSVTGNPVNKWTAMVVKKLDRVFLTEYSKKHSTKGGK